MGSTSPGISSDKRTRPNLDWVRVSCRPLDRAWHQCIGFALDRLRREGGILANQTLMSDRRWDQSTTAGPCWNPKTPSGDAWTTCALFPDLQQSGVDAIMSDPLSSLRRDYAQGNLDELDVDPSPFRQFEKWLGQIRETSTGEANAMTLATVDADGCPSARTVLLKGFDHRGLVFFTHYDSQKGREIASHPRVATVFYWPTFERQVRISGIASPTSADESDAYFVSRPAGSQIGAAASRQSTVVESRAWLETRFAELENQVDRGEPIQRPERWGGYRIRPLEFEFWQGRPNRLHDRIRFRLIEDSWEMDRLAP